MADLFLTEHGSHIRLKGDNLEVYYDEKKIATVSLNHLDSIQIYGYIQFSTQVLYKVMRAGVEMAFHTQEGKLVGQVTPPLPKNLNLRVWQHRIQSNHEFKTGITKTLIRLKFQGGIRLLEEYAKNRDDLDISASINDLRTWQDKLEKASGIPEILGLEGSFAMIYYKNYAKLFKNPEVFQGRSKRPPMDPANAVLSYSYTIMTNRIGSYLDGLGYDPFLGIFHTVDYGRMSLGCDLVEAIRPIFCDWTVLKWFNLNVFDPKEDFEPQKGGVYMNQKGQRKFFPQFRKEWDNPRYFLGEKFTVFEMLQILHKWLRDSLREEKALAIEDYVKFEEEASHSDEERSFEPGSNPL